MFKNFHETYFYCAFALVFGLLYPNKRNLVKRALIFACLLLINTPMLLWFGHYTVECLLKLDLFNTARNITLGVLIGLYFIKIFNINYKTAKFEKILSRLSADLIHANGVDECCQKLYRKYIKVAKRGEICWIFIPILLTAQFSVYAGICNIYKILSGSMEPKNMIHDMDLKYLEDIQYDTPVFEIFFLYNTAQSIIIAIAFVGIDGSFCIVTTHLCLKIELISHNIDKIFKNAKNKRELHIKLKDIIRDHQQAIDFYNEIQEVYGTWLLSVFMISATAIALNVYILNTIHELHPKYVVYSISCVIHIYTPCFYCSTLTKASEDLATDIYKANWEKWADPAITKQLTFMIANAQKPMILTGNGMVTFNMQLFISVIQSSYSFFTLISSR